MGRERGGSGEGGGWRHSEVDPLTQLQEARDQGRNIGYTSGALPTYWEMYPSEDIQGGCIYSTSMSQKSILEDPNFLGNFS